MSAASILQFIEGRFGLPPLASINHQFDPQTPGTNNDATDGQTHDPSEPPRDGKAQIGDFYEAFNFSCSLPASGWCEKEDDTNGSRLAPISIIIFFAQGEALHKKTID